MKKYDTVKFIIAKYENTNGIKVNSVGCIVEEYSDKDVGVEFFDDTGNHKVLVTMPKTDLELVK